MAEVHAGREHLVHPAEGNDLVRRADLPFFAHGFGTEDHIAEPAFVNLVPEDAQPFEGEGNGLFPAPSFPATRVKDYAPPLHEARRTGGRQYVFVRFFRVFAREIDKVRGVHADFHAGRPERRADGKGLCVAHVDAAPERIFKASSPRSFTNAADCSLCLSPASKKLCELTARSEFYHVPVSFAYRARAALSAPPRLKIFVCPLKRSRNIFPVPRRTDRRRNR